MTNHSVIIIGGGIAGLSAALELARFNIDVRLVEKSHFAGGHAVQFTCKATDKCVKCNACMVDEKLSEAVQNDKIRLMTGARVTGISETAPFTVQIEKRPAFIDPSKCTECGICFDQCPVPGAVSRGTSAAHHPFFAIEEDICPHIHDQSCLKCQNACPEQAIDLSNQSESIETQADGVIFAS